MRARFALVPLLWLTVASAAPKADPVTTASDLMAEAEFDKALAVLDGALRTAKQPADIARIQLLRGQALVALLRTDDATTAFGAALAANPQADLDPATASPDAVSALAKARRSILSELTVAVGGGAKANIRLDDAEMGPSPLKTKVGAGKHRVEAIAASGERVLKEIEIIPGKPMAVTLELPLAAASLPPPPPPPTPAAEPGTSPSPAPAAVVSRPAPKRGSSSGGSKLGFIPVGVGVAALGGGIACVVLAQGNHQQLVNPSGPKLDGATEAKLAGDGAMFQTIGWVGIGVGAAAGVAGAAMLLFMGGGSGGGDTGSSVHLSASATPSGGYVGLRGTFQ